MAADANRPARRRAAAHAAEANASCATSRAPCCCLPSPLAGAIRSTVARSPSAGASESVAPAMPLPARDRDEDGVVV